MRRVILACLALAAASPAIGQETSYLDDRSGPAALVRSLYNAIDRGEFVRAWSYFSEPPAPSVEAYAQGYADTESVELTIGTPRTEGTAGSIYHEVPVAVLAHRTDGSSRTFAGCYTLRMADPTVGETFEPLHIESGSLAPSDAEFAEALPRRCGDGPDLPAHDAALEKAKAIYATLDACNASRMPFMTPEDLAPDTHSIGFNYEFDEDDQPQRIVRLFRFLCYTAAYNQGHVYFLADDEGEVSPLHFARPALDIRYVGDSDENVEAVNVNGFSTYSVLVNSDYDPETRTVSSMARWRGMGDASTAGRWIFRNGDFDLVHYTVDASYDGEMNGEVVVDYETAP